MLRVLIDRPDTPAPRKIAQVVEVLARGGVAAYPTDSVYALGTAMESRAGFERIAAARGMKKSRRLALLCPDLATAAQFAQFSQTAFRLAQRIFPGPYTLILPATRDVPRLLTDERRRTVGIRIPSHPITAALLQGLRRPMISSSAIPPGEDAACETVDELVDAFGHALDAIIEVEAVTGLPSTVIEVDGESITLVREGQGPTDHLFS